MEYFLHKLFDEIKWYSQFSWSKSEQTLFGVAAASIKPRETLTILADYSRCKKVET